MAIALVGTPVVASDAGSSTTLASPALSTTTGNSLLVGCLSQQGDFVGTTITGVVDTAGNTYTPLTMQGSGGAGAQILRWFYCHNITGNASNVATGTWSASTATRHIIQIEFSGAKNQAPVSEGGNFGLGVSTAPVNIAMGSTVGAVFAMATSSNDRTWTPGSGFTEINDWGASAGAEYYTGFNATGTVVADMMPTTATNLSLVAVGFEEAPVAPVVTRDPVSTNVVVGSTATFAVEGVSGDGTLNYQWQDNSGGSFADIGGATSSTYTTAASTSSFQRRQYRCRLTNLGGSTNSASATLTLSWHDVYLYSMPEDADPDDVRLRDPTQAAAGGTHTTTGALAAQDATIAGTATHSALHATAGALASQDATIAGTAVHLTLHTSTGTLSAQAATIAGTAAHQHAATGALSAQAATIAGTAAHAVTHTSTGALTAQDATISGAAAHQHATTGALSAQAAAIAGTATHFTLHTTTGALTAQDATIAGTAADEHASTGALAAQDATIAGTVAHLTLHTTTGALAAQDAAIAGSADHTTAGASHSASGALTAQDATVAGVATHLTLHTSTGALTAQDATIAGTAAHQHTATGALAADAATISGAAAHLTLHTSTGALAADAAAVSGAAAHEHAATGALSAQAAAVDGSAVHAAAGVHIASGALAAGDATLSGAAEYTGTGENVLSPKFLGSPNVVIRGAKAEGKASDATPLPAQITNVPDAPPPVKLSPSVMDMLGFAPPITPLPVEVPEVPELKVKAKPRKEPPAAPAPEVAPPPPPAPPPAPVDPVKAVEVRLDALNSQLETALSEVAALRAKLEAQASAQVQVKTAVERVAVDTAAIARREQNRQRAEEITRRLLKDLAEED